MRAIFAAAMLCVAVSPALAEIASCYGAESGRQTASGERFDWHAMTAAHRSLPFGTLVRACYSGHASGLQSRGTARGVEAGASVARCVTVRITDRGPFHRDAKTKLYDRDIDLSDGACGRIGLLGPGVDAVVLEILGSR